MSEQSTTPHGESSYRSLFDAFAEQKYNGVPLKSIPDTIKLIVSVINYLERSFNTRKGSVASNLEYGLPDFPNIHDKIPKDVKTYTEIIENCIRKFEPRITTGHVIGWGVDKGTLKLHCIIFIMLISGEKYKLKLTLQGLGNNTLEIVE